MRCTPNRSLLFTGFATAALLAGARSALADVRLPAIFGDGMVLQADLPLRIYGWADPGEAVDVRIRLDAEEEPVRKARTTGDDAGRFVVSLEPLAAGGEYVVEISAKNELVLRDVWLGEVWICSGQSNMEWPVAQSSDAEREIATANDRFLRLFVVERATAPDAPADDVRGTWMHLTPESVPNFSAVAYSFGRELALHTGSPVGLIQAAWGGTPAESWTERSFLEGDERFEAILERRPDRAPLFASSLYNGMIAPLARLRVRGVIWYQGESNASRAEQYRALFPALIRSWRAAFDDAGLAFLFVQLANYGQRAPEPEESDWAELREAQQMALELPLTGMATAIDVGEADDIHPRDKRTVGERLALVARALAYGEALEHSGPVLKGVERRGNELVVRFDHAAGLRTSDGAAPRGFAIADENGAFHWADARIEGDAVVLSSSAVAEPVHARHAWAMNPDVNLRNGAGLPALPFRTDDRPLTTAGKR